VLERAPGRLHEQIVIVTGGAQGIGRAYCEGLADEGASVVVADINGPAGEATAAELTRNGAQALAVRTDVMDPDATDHMARVTVERYGRVDALVNNAAMFQRPAVSRGPFEEIPVEEWDRVMTVNIKGVFLCCRAVAPYMKEQRRGKIVNISSSTVHMGTPQFAHYVTSKAGVIGLTRVLARELGEHNITVNAVAPGQTLSLDDVPEERLKRYESMAQTRSLKRIQMPRDLVGTVVFLCSSDSDFLTGQTLVVDGGAVMH
jgi:3-oxoacyl-[acyl-carrier protein] reductase